MIPANEETLRHILERYQIGLKGTVETILDLIEKGHYEAASTIAMRVRGALDAHNDFLLERIGQAVAAKTAALEKPAPDKAAKGKASAESAPTT